MIMRVSLEMLFLNLNVIELFKILETVLTKLGSEKETRWKTGSRSAKMLAFERLPFLARKSKR